MQRRTLFRSGFGEQQRGVRKIEHRLNVGQTPHPSYGRPLHGSAGTLAGELPVELFAGKGAGAPGNGSLVQGFKTRYVPSANSLPTRWGKGREGPPMQPPGDHQMQ